jgi:hypothetical protein
MRFNRVFVCVITWALLWGSKGVAQTDVRLDDRLIGHWPLEADARDRSVSQRDATNRGVTFGGCVSGKPAARFGGRNQLLEIPAGKSPRWEAGDFSVAAWVHTSESLDDALGDIISQFDDQSRCGFSLRVTTSGIAMSQPNVRHLSFGIDNGRIEPTWTDHGRPGQAIYIMAMATHAGRLFVGTCEPEKNQSGHVYRLGDRGKWIDCGSPDASNAVPVLAEFNGQLYAGTAKYRVAGSALKESENENLGGRIFRYEADGKWIPCGQLPDTAAIGGMIVYRGKLYASSLYAPPGFFRYLGEQTWERLESPFGKRVQAMTVHDGGLFAVSYDGGRVYRFDGATWTDCGLPGEKTTQTYGFAIYRGRLYVSTWPMGRVFRYAGEQNWEDAGRLGEELEVMGLMVHNGKLYGGTLPLADVQRFDGDGKWTSIGRVDLTPDVKYRRAWTMAEYRGRMFWGTLPSGKVMSIAAGKNVTSDVPLAPGWQHVAAIRRGRHLELHINGERIAQSSEFNPADYDLRGAAAQPLQIGFGPTDYFHGCLRDVRIYDRALSPAEIKAVVLP